MGKTNKSKFATFPTETPPDHEARLTDPARLAALTASEIMDGGREEVFDRPVRLATAMLGVPVGLASFVDDHRQVFKAQRGLSADEDAHHETPLTHSFCQYVVANGRPLAVNDARAHPLLKSNLAVPDLGVIAYLGVPIHAPGGEVLGSFCAIDGTVREWTDQDVEVLTDLAMMIETELRLRHERDAMQTLARELNHRVKNLFSIIGGMVAITARSADTPADMAQALQGRLAALDRAHGMISPALAEGDLHDRSTDLRALIEQLVAPHLMPGGTDVAIDVPQLGLTGRAVTDLALVIHELATNAAKYGALSVKGGSLHVAGALNADALVLTWRERGGPEVAGPPSERGFGSKLVEITIGRQMQGGLDTTWHPGGVEHVLTIPRGIFDTPDAEPETAEAR